MMESGRVLVKNDCNSGDDNDSSNIGDDEEDDDCDDDIGSSQKRRKCNSKSNKSDSDTENDTNIDSDANDDDSGVVDTQSWGYRASVMLWEELQQKWCYWLPCCGAQPRFP